MNENKELPIFNWENIPNETKQVVPNPVFEEQEEIIMDFIETFAEQLEKIDIATELCHELTLEQMRLLKKLFIKK